MEASIYAAVGKRSAPEDRYRFSFLDRAVSVLRSPPYLEQTSSTARSSKANRYPIFGGASFPNSVIAV
eukprot:552707-Prorocentrum_minimum.AAC.2